MSQKPLQKQLHKLNISISLRSIARLTTAQIDVLENLVHHEYLASRLANNDQSMFFKNALMTLVSEFEELGGPGKAWMSMPKLNTLAGQGMDSGSNILCKSISRISTVSILVGSSHQKDQDPLLSETRYV